MVDKPFFSVIIPCYNRGHVLERTIHSVLEQEETDFEVIIIDDGSTDNTREIAKAITDERVQYYHQENRERGAARNHGVRRANGNYITFLDSDDIFYPDHLKEAKKALQNLMECQFYFQPYEFVDTAGKRLRSLPALPQKLNLMLVKKGNFMSCLGVFIERQLALDNPFQDNRQLAGSEDYELWLRLAARVPLQSGRKVTAALVQHPDRSVYNFKAEPLIERKERFLKYLQNDRPFMDRYSAYWNEIRAGAYSYIALHLPLESSSKQLRIHYAIKAIKCSPGIMFSKRFAVIIRQTFLGR